MERRIVRSALLLGLCALICHGAAFAGSIIRVKPTGSDSNSGASWPLAKQTIQAALAAAVSGDDIWVAAGTYTGSVALKTGVGLYGGFAGSEESASERDWRANVTTLDGQQATNVVVIPAMAEFCSLDGFAVANGATDYYGGGIYCANGSRAEIRHNVIENNFAALMGGGIYCDYSSHPVIEGNVIRGNDCPGGSGFNGFGGAVHLHLCGGNVFNNVICDNTADYGGGVSVYNASVFVRNNTICFNTAINGGGIYTSGHPGSADLGNNIVAFNSSGIANVSLSAAPVCKGNDVYGNTGGNYSGTIPLVDDISADPMFRDADARDFHLLFGSPCLETGSYPIVPTADFDGRPRPQDGDLNGVAECDIGAFEYRRICVKSNSPSPSDGSTWAKAYHTPAEALAAALDGDDVWVAAAAYQGGLVLPAGVSLLGGFAGTESDPADRNWSTNVTTLDGNGARHVLSVAEGATPATLIDGFTITGGAATALGGPPSGGGVYCYRASPTVRNNIVTGNSASGLTGAYGGGIYCFESDARIINNLVTHNTLSASVSPQTKSGAGIYCNGGAPLCVGNTVCDNSQGGGVYLANCDAALHNNLIAFNDAGVVASGATVALRNNDVYGNVFLIVRNYAGIPDPTGTNGNISADPDFVDKAAEDYHLLGDSPCINAGSSDAPRMAAKDLDAQPRAMGAGVDIGADEFLPVARTVSEAKLQQDGLPVELSFVLITADLGDCEYVEPSHRSCGIRIVRKVVEPPSGVVEMVDTRAMFDVKGVAATTEGGERYIASANLTLTGFYSGAVVPKTISGRNSGGGDLAPDPLFGAGQKGVKNGFGLNNIGLLVRICGLVTRVDPARQSFTVWDGSNAWNGQAIKDRYSFIGVRVLATGLSLPSVGDYVAVTGALSCEKPIADVYPLLRPRAQADITVH